MKIETEVLLDFSDVLIKPKRGEVSSRKDANLGKSFTFRHSKQAWVGVPIMAANMDGVGTIDMANALDNHKMFTCLTKDITAEALRNLAVPLNYEYVALSTGISDSDFIKLKEILAEFPFKFINIDVANGYMENFLKFIVRVRAAYPVHTIIAGNVVTPEQTTLVISSGADIVKVGLGSGVMCLTRQQTGIGYPQLSAIIDCAAQAHQHGAHIISDGGCTCPGDVAKAFGAGADFVMLGGMLSGTDQGGGNIVRKRIITSEQRNMDWEARLPVPVVDQQLFVEFYGMSSDTANEKHFGGLQDYRASEGRTVLTPYKGDVNLVIQNILGGLRSTLTYTGSRSLAELSDNTTFIRVSKQLNQPVGVLML